MTQLHSACGTLDINASPENLLQFKWDLNVNKLIELKGIATVGSNVYFAAGGKVKVKMTFCVFVWAVTRNGGMDGATKRISNMLEKHINEKTQRYYLNIDSLVPESQCTTAKRYFSSRYVIPPYPPFICSVSLSYISFC